MIVSVDADFAQFYLRRDGGWFDGDASALVLAGVDDDNGAAMMTVYQQHGPLDVEVEVTDAPPPPLGQEWADVVEVPLLAPAPDRITGWDPHDVGHQLPLDPGRAYRLRYAINPRTEPARYLLQLWPAEPAPGFTVRIESPSGQYWGFQSDATAAVMSQDIVNG